MLNSSDLVFRVAGVVEVGYPQKTPQTRNLKTDKLIVKHLSGHKVARSIPLRESMSILKTKCHCTLNPFVNPHYCGVPNSHYLPLQRDATRFLRIKPQLLLSARTARMRRMGIRDALLQIRQLLPTVLVLQVLVEEHS